MKLFGKQIPGSRKVPGRLSYDEAYALCALGSWIVYHGYDGFVYVAVDPLELEAAHKKGATVFFESAHRPEQS